jgi:acetyl esterase/lipase
MSEATETSGKEIDAVIALIEANPFAEEIADVRVQFDAMGAPIADDITVEKVDADGVPCQMLTPPGADTDRVIVYVHGGGYVFGSLVSHGGTVGELARASNCCALQVDYRLAPEHPFPAAVEDACTAYRYLVKNGTAPEKITIMGDSAGGGLAIAAIVALRDAGDTTPGAAVCISPWIDLEGTGESVTARADVDPMVSADMLHGIAATYLGDADPKSPTASPIHANLNGLPPVLIQVGEREILYSDSEALATKAKIAGADVTFKEWPEMIHVWHLFYPMLTEAREAIKEAGAFVIAKTGG